MLQTVPFWPDSSEMEAVVTLTGVDTKPQTFKCDKPGTSVMEFNRIPHQVEKIK